MYTIAKLARLTHTYIVPQKSKLKITLTSPNLRKYLREFGKYCNTVRVAIAYLGLIYRNRYRDSYKLQSVGPKYASKYNCKWKHYNDLNMFLFMFRLLKIWDCFHSWSWRKQTTETERSPPSESSEKSRASSTSWEGFKIFETNLTRPWCRLDKSMKQVRQVLNACQEYCQLVKVWTNLNASFKNFF